MPKFSMDQSSSNYKTPELKYATKLEENILNFVHIQNILPGRAVAIFEAAFQPATRP